MGKRSTGIHSQALVCCTVIVDASLASVLGNAWQHVPHPCGAPTRTPPVTMTEGCTLRVAGEIRLHVWSHWSTVWQKCCTLATYLGTLGKRSVPIRLQQGMISSQSPALGTVNTRALHALLRAPPRRSSAVYLPRRARDRLLRGATWRSRSTWGDWDTDSCLETSGLAGSLRPTRAGARVTGVFPVAGAVYVPFGTWSRTVLPIFSTPTHPPVTHTRTLCNGYSD